MRQDSASARNRANARKVANPTTRIVTSRRLCPAPSVDTSPSRKSAPPKVDHLDAARRKRRGEERAPPRESGRRKPVKPRFEPSEA